ncbi:MAG: toll/interleukin-1 receptor domain-containing protein, partial [Thiobacillaceae bacterium]
MSNPIRLFVSYSHQDEDWCKLFYGMLKSSNFDIWIDEHKIRAGDKWNNEIDTGLLEADAALLLVSLRFMNSPFIQMEELPHILERHQAGLRLFVVLVGDYPCDGVPWLSQIERFPRGDRSLASYGSPTDPKAEEMVADIVKEITRQVNDPFISASGPQRQLARDLLSEALLRSLDATSTGSLTAKMVDSIAKVTSLRGLSLYHAVRFFVEFQLFRFEDPTSPTALMQSLNEASSDLLIGLKEGAEKGGDYSRVRIKVEPIFFMWARDREHLWQRYFENLVRTSQAFPEKIDATRTLAQIDVQAGFIAPQFLVAGLMARFDNDWKPVLQAFPRAMADADDKAGNFASLQASQWITWLMWGPSVPICRCAQWQGAYAFQFAYGDENNSLPLLEVVSNGGTPALEAFSVKTTANGRGADRVKLRAALRWAPFVLGRAKPTVSTDANAVEPTGLEEARSDSHPTAPLRLLEIANAQAALIRGNAFAANQSNGLLLQLEEMLNTGAENDEAQVYFTAYLWMMFLVAKATQDEAGPRLLSGAIYPKLPGPQG